MKRFIYSSFIMTLLLTMSLPLLSRERRPIEINFSRYEADFYAGDELDVSRYVNRGQEVAKVRVYASVKDYDSAEVEAFSRRGRFIDSGRLGYRSSAPTLHSDRNMNIDYLTFTEDVTVDRILIFVKEKHTTPDRPDHGSKSLFIGNCNVNWSNCRISVSGKIRANYSQIKVEVISGPVGVNSIIASPGSGWGAGGYAKVSGVLGVGSVHHFPLTTNSSINHIDVNVASGSGNLKLTLVR